MSSHIAKVFDNTYKWGVSSKWTENCQMYKLALEKAEEPDQVVNIH